MKTDTGIPVNTSKWENGTVVALESHFYTEQINTDMIVYSGEPKLISPLMVIVESIPEKKSYHPATGDLLEAEDEKNYQCKCIWFSSKNFQFEEAWMSSRLLRVIKPVTESISYKHGDLVELRSSEVELGKKKSSLKTKNSQNETSITSELNFVSPIMQVIGTTKNEIKEPLRDPNTQKPKRFISKMLVKCKYYNSVSEKMTEVLIAIEALNFIQKVDGNILNLIEQSLRERKHITINIKTTNEPAEGELRLPKHVLLDPKKVNFRAGRYYLVAFNYFTAKVEEINFTDLFEPNIIDDWCLEELPHFRINRAIPKITPINIDNIKKMITRKKPLWITYKDYNEVETKRIVSNYSLIQTEEDYYGKKEKVLYLKAYCHFRQANRHFRVDGIKAIKELNII